MYRGYIRENDTLVSVVMFIIIFGIIQMMKQKLLLQMTLLIAVL